MYEVRTNPENQSRYSSSVILKVALILLYVSLIIMGYLTFFGFIFIYQLREIQAPNLQNLLSPRVNVLQIFTPQLVHKHMKLFPYYPLYSD